MLVCDSVLAGLLDSAVQKMEAEKHCLNHLITYSDINFLTDTSYAGLLVLAIGGRRSEGLGGNNWINQGVHKICQLKMFWTMDEISCMKWLVHPFHFAYILLSTSVLTPPNLHGTLKNGFRLGAMLLSDQLATLKCCMWWF